MYQRDDDDVEYYFPQLCTLALAKIDTSDLHTYLLDKAAVNMTFALKTHWFFAAASSSMPNPTFRDAAMRLWEESEMAVVNCRALTRNNLLNKSPLRPSVPGPVLPKYELDLAIPRSTSNPDLTIMRNSVTSSPMTSPLVGARVALDLSPHDTLRNSLEMLRGISRATLAMGAASFLADTNLSVFRELREPFGPSTTQSVQRQADDGPSMDLFAAKQLRCDFFNLQNAVVNMLTKLATVLATHPNRQLCFTSTLCQFNQWLFERRAAVALSTGIFRLSGVSLPLASRRDIEGMQLLRVHVEDCRVFKTRTRAPFLLTVEMCDADEAPGGAEGACARVLSELGMEAPLFSRRELRAVLAKATPELWVRQFYGPQLQPALRQDTRDEGAVRARRKIWGEQFEMKQDRLRKESPYGSLKSWRLSQIVVKSGDDVRQEVLASQLVRMFRKVFEEESLPLWLRPYDVVVTGVDSGLMEFVPNTVSVDSLKKDFPGVKSLHEIFGVVYADQLMAARQNFVESLAAYCIVCYLLQVRDRHNGNLLLDTEGHLIHIDYGYMLSNAPGKIGFENSPFKLTQEYLDIMGGDTSELFDSFQKYVILGFLAVRKRSEQFLLIVRLMGECGPALPCFSSGIEPTVQAMADRFFPSCTEEVCMERIVELIDNSVNNWRTITYDNFQRLTNGIL